MMVSWPQTPPLGEFLPDPGPWSPGEDLHKEARRERRESRSRPGKWPNPVPGNQITPINHCQKPHVNRLCNVGEKIKGAIGWLHSQGVGVVIKLQPGGEGRGGRVFSHHKSFQLKSDEIRSLCICSAPIGFHGVGLAPGGRPLGAARLPTHALPRMTACVRERENDSREDASP